MVNVANQNILLDVQNVNVQVALDARVGNLVTINAGAQASITRVRLQISGVDAEARLKDAFSTDVRPAIREWAKARGLAEDPMDAFRQSGYLEKITADRSSKNMATVSSYA